MKKVYFFILFLTVLFSCKNAKIKEKNATKLYFNVYDYGQTEIMSPTGIRVLINIVDPSKLTSEMTRRDIILKTTPQNTVPTTMFSETNENTYFESRGKDLIKKTGVIQIDDVRVTSIPSAYGAGDEINEDDATNYMFVIEINGVRIAHLGFVGQLFLTREQRDQLGKIDLLISQFTNSFLNLNVENKRAYQNIQLINPRIVVPTQSSFEGLEYASKIWKFFYTDNPLTVTKELFDTNFLKGRINCLLVGKERKSFGKKLRARKWNVVVR